MANEKTALLSSGGKDHGATRAKRQSRFGDAGVDKGVRPSRESVSFSLDILTSSDTPSARTEARKSIAGGLRARKSRAQSFFQRPDGTINTMSELYDMCRYYFLG